MVEAYHIGCDSFHILAYLVGNAIEGGIDEVLFPEVCFVYVSLGDEGEVAEIAQKSYDLLYVIGLESGILDGTFCEEGEKCGKGSPLDGILLDEVLEVIRLEEVVIARCIIEELLQVIFNARIVDIS